MCKQFCTNLYSNIFTQFSYKKDDSNEIFDINNFLDDYYYGYSNYYSQYNKLYYYNGKILDNIEDY